MNHGDVSFASLTLTVAALFCAACDKQEGTSTPGAKDAVQVKCFGVNGCAGQSACDVPAGMVAEGSKGHACAGQNSCEGKGWIKLPAPSCEEKGGTVLT